LLRGIEEIRSGRIVDLSHRLYPGREEFLLDVRTKDAETVVPRMKKSPEAWYIMQEISLSSHIGTHIEAPYHHMKEGKGASELPLEKLIGPGILLDFHTWQDNQPIAKEDIKRAGEIHPGDIAFIRTDRSKLYRTDAAHNRPFLTLEAIRFLIEKGINVLGIDATGIGQKDVLNQPDHQMLFESEIPLVECLANLGSLTRARFFVMILPLPIEGIDSSPVRVVAVE